MTDFFEDYFIFCWISICSQIYPIFMIGASSSKVLQKNADYIKLIKCISIYLAIVDVMAYKYVDTFAKLSTSISLSWISSPWTDSKCSTTESNNWNRNSSVQATWTRLGCTCSKRSEINKLKWLLNSCN